MIVTAGTSCTSLTGALLLFLGERLPSARSRMCDPVGLYVSQATSRVDSSFFAGVHAHRAAATTSTATFMAHPLQQAGAAEINSAAPVIASPGGVFQKLTSTPAYHMRPNGSKVSAAVSVPVISDCAFWPSTGGFLSNTLSAPAYTAYSRSAPNA